MKKAKLVISATLMLAIGWVLVPRPAPSISPNILRVELASESYPAIDRATVDRVFGDCQTRLQNFASQINRLRSTAFYLSWLGYACGVCAVLIAYFVRAKGRPPDYPPSPREPTGPSPTSGTLAARLGGAFALLAVLLMGAGHKAMSDSQTVEHKMYRLRDAAGYTLVSLDLASSEAEAANVLERLEVEIATTK